MRRGLDGRPASELVLRGHVDVRWWVLFVVGLLRGVLSRRATVRVVGVLLSVVHCVRRVRALNLVFELVALKRAVFRQVLHPPDLPVLLSALTRRDQRPLDDRAREWVDLRHNASRGGPGLPI
jgi:hypothetical protein